MRRSVFVAVAVIAGGAFVSMRRSPYGLAGDTFLDNGLEVVESGFIKVGLMDRYNETLGLSFGGLNLIKKWEGLKLYVYDANPPHRDFTIGYGHKVKPGESFGIITEAKATALLRRDVLMGENRVKNSIKYQLSQRQFDALVSVAFNVTWRSWKMIAARMNKGEEVGSVLTRYVYGSGVRLDGLVSRRADEVAYYKTGNFA